MKKCCKFQTGSKVLKKIRTIDGDSDKSKANQCICPNKHSQSEINGNYDWCHLTQILIIFHPDSGKIRHCHQFYVPQN